MAIKFTSRPALRESPLNKFRAPAGQGGFTLIELLVVLAILAILAAVTVPTAEVAVKRDRELELKRDLRDMRSAIDRFHADWSAGALSRLGPAASEEGYPKSLSLLMEGADGTGPGNAKLKYLRRVPENPLGDPSLPPEKQWGLRSYQDDAHSTEWGGQDVFDVYCPGDGTALDGSYYHDW